jgi:cation-transporting P-type ATPase C
VHAALKACLQYKVKHRQLYRTRLKLPVLFSRDALCSQIEKLLRELSGVTGVEVHASTGSVILEHPDGLVEIAAVLEIIDEALARPVPQGNSSPVLPTKSTKCRLCGTDRSLKNTDKKNHVSGLVLVASGLYLLYLWMRHLFSASPVPISAVSRVTSLPALVALGLSIPIQRQAIQNLKRTGKPDIGILSTGLLYLSILFGNAVTALVVFWLFNLSGWLESRIRERTRTAVRAMLAIPSPLTELLSRAKP